MILNRLKYQLIILALLMLCNFSVVAQNIDHNIKHLELPEEIGVVNARSFVEDNDGFLYIGLINGLYRYDGHDVKEIKCVNASGVEYDLTNIEKLVVDYDGEIVILCRQNAYIFNPKTDITRLFILSESIGVIYRVGYVTRNNEIVIGTNKGLRIYNKKTNKYESYIHDSYNLKSLSHNVVRDVYEDLQGNLWVGTYNKLNKFDRKTKQFTAFDLKPKNAIQDKNNLILKIELLPDGTNKNLVVGTETGLSIFNMQDYSFKTYTSANTNNSISNDVVKTVFPISNDEVWFGTDFGLNKFSLEDERVTNFFHEFGNKNSISHDVVSCLFMDKQGNLWIGTDNGIDKIYIPDNNILFNQTGPNKKQRLGSIEVNSFSEDSKGNIWFATNQGLIKYDSKTDDYMEYHPPQILHTKVSNIFIDKSDNVWLATPGGINKINTKIDKISSYTAREEPKGYLTSNYISDLTLDNKGNLWVGTHNKGLFLLPQGKTDGNFISVNLNNVHNISFNGISGLSSDDNNNLWVENFTNVLKLNIETQEIEVLSVRDNAPRNAIHNTYSDDKTFWVSAINGIFNWDENEQNFNKINDFQIKINGFVVDDNLIWFTNHSNLFKYNLEDNILKKIPSYLTQNIKFNKNGFKDASGRIYFSSFDGFVSFDPSQLLFDTDEQNIRFTDFKVLGKSWIEDKAFYDKTLQNKPLNDINEIDLAYNDNSFDISFSSLNLIDNKSISYSYMLEGYDDNWKTLADGSNTANYVKVQPGSYTFKVNTSDSFGVKSDNTREFSIKVRAPFYASNLAIFIYVLLLVGAIITAHKIIISREQYNNRIKLETFQRKKTEELAELKTKFFSTITHELKTPLTLIKAPIERILSEEKDETKVKNFDIINRNANRLIKLVNQILDLRKFEKGLEKLEIQEYNIIKFSETIFKQFENEAAHRHLNMYFNSNVKSLRIWFDLEKMEKILINLLSNAYKFTPDGGTITLKIDYKKKMSRLHVSVIDSGAGIKLEDQSQIFQRFSNIESTNYSNQGGSGIGLSLAKEYVNLHNGDISFKSKVGKGSEFTFDIPTNKSSYIEYVEKTHEEEKIEESILVDEEDTQKEIESVALEKKGLPLMLIVEDEMDMREFLESSLNSKYNVIVAKDGVEGLTKATKRIPDIIISDVMMPEMDGYEMCKKLKTDIRTSHIPIILLSARGDSKSKLAGVEFGADDYVGKPFQLSYLITKSKNLIEQRDQLKSSYIKQHSTELSKIQVSSLDENFLKKVVTVIEKNIEKSELNVKMLGELVSMNHTNFYRKIKGLTGQTANDFIRSIRLKKAAQLLKTKQYNVKEVMFKVGFSNRSYFSKSFKTLFGISPKDYK